MPEPTRYPSAYIDDPEPGTVMEIVEPNEVVFAWVFGEEGKWWFSDRCLGQARIHDDGTFTIVKERELYY